LEKGDIKNSKEKKFIVNLEFFLASNENLEGNFPLFKNLHLKNDSNLLRSQVLKEVERI